MKTLARWCFHPPDHRPAWPGSLPLVGLTAIALGASAAPTATTSSSRTPQSFDAVSLLQKNAPKASGDTDQIVIAAKRGSSPTPPRARGCRRCWPESPAAARHRHRLAVRGRPRAPDLALGTDWLRERHLRRPGANKLSDRRGQGVRAHRSPRPRGTISSSRSRARSRGDGNQHNDASSVGFGFIAAAIVLFIVFGSLLAMSLPLLTAAVSLGTGHRGRRAALARAQHGLVLQRARAADRPRRRRRLRAVHRHPLPAGTAARADAPRRPSVEALDTSGRAVLFAGVIVCIAMLGMFALGRQLPLRSGGRRRDRRAFTVIASLTLLPALLGFFGLHRAAPARAPRATRARAAPPPTSRPCGPAGQAVMQRRPAVFAVVGRAGHDRDRDSVLLDAPRLRRRRQRSRRLDHPQGLRPARQGLRSRLQRTAAARSRRSTRRPSRQASCAWCRRSRPRPAWSAPPRRDSSPASTAARSRDRQRLPQGLAPGRIDGRPAAHRPRPGGPAAAAVAPGCSVLVGGTTAIFDDFSHVLSRKLPLFIGVVVLLSFLLLMAVFRSLAIPLTAAVMNLLSAGAAFGIVTAVFQNGWGRRCSGSTRRARSRPSSRC